MKRIIEDGKMKAKEFYTNLKDKEPFTKLTKTGITDNLKNVFKFAESYARAISNSPTLDQQPAPIFGAIAVERESARKDLNIDAIESLFKDMNKIKEESKGFVLMPSIEGFRVHEINEDVLRVMLTSSTGIMSVKEGYSTEREREAIPSDCVRLPQSTYKHKDGGMRTSCFKMVDGRRIYFTGRENLFVPSDSKLLKQYNEYLEGLHNGIDFTEHKNKINSFQPSSEEKYCKCAIPTHTMDDAPYCVECDRVINWDVRYIKLKITDAFKAGSKLHSIIKKLAEDDVERALLDMCEDGHSGNEWIKCSRLNEAITKVEPPLPPPCRKIKEGETPIPPKSLDK